MPVNFNTYKTNTVQKLYNRRLINKQDAKEILQARTRCGFADRVTECYFEKADNFSEYVTPNESSLIRSIQEKIDNLTIGIAKIFSRKDTDPVVLALKKQIKREFGIKNLYLDNNSSYAKRIKKALKILKDNNMLLPDEIIVNSILQLNMAVSNPKKRVMILNSNLKTDGSTSTNSIYHFIIHEGIHIGQPNNVKIMFQKMPEEFKETISNLSFYADNNFILEVHAELMAKKLLRPKEFTPKEQEALDYIENLFRIYS